MSKRAESGGAGEHRRRGDVRTIAIVGLGQIGGSLVLAIRRKNLPYQIIGIDISRKRLRLLHRMLDESSSRWENTKEADLVIVCLHYKETVRFLKQAPKNQLIMDVCSTKKVLSQLAEKLGLRFIGGHPLCGNERSGEKGWKEDLFHKVPFFLCASSGSNPSDRSSITRFIRKLDAKPIAVNPALHDRFMADTSHFPAFLSILLAESTRRIPAYFKGPGHKSMTRLSVTNRELLRTFLDSNRANILKSASDLRARLDRWIGTNSKTR